MAEPARRLMTVEEFLAFDDRTDTRYELVGGELVAMAAASPAHGTLVVNAAAIVRSRLPPGCRAMTQVAVPVGAHDSFVPDLVVTCTGALDARFVADPVLVVEVLSPSTRSFDLGEKADRYSQLPSCREIWLVDSTRSWMRLWRRAGELWTVTLPIVEGGFESEVLAAEIPLAELYQGSGLLETPG
ncbi:MAG: hypothetical protein KatS3mg117_2966 [Geminicoccaceae bacterium]|jgi:Uma2 family endonuclease|nr:MAG: hypothetical protein KatS3mg117_2966 [Geminicoccaceae bacterium]